MRVSEVKGLWSGSFGAPAERKCACAGAIKAGKERPLLESSWWLVVFFFFFFESVQVRPEKVNEFDKLEETKIECAGV